MQKGRTGSALFVFPPLRHTLKKQGTARRNSSPETATHGFSFSTSFLENHHQSAEKKNTGKYFKKNFLENFLQNSKIHIVDFQMFKKIFGKLYELFTTCRVFIW